MPAMAKRRAGSRLVSIIYGNVCRMKAATALMLLIQASVV